MDQMTIIVEESATSAAELAEIRQEAIGVRCRIEVVASWSLSRFVGKAQRIIDGRVR